MNNSCQVSLIISVYNNYSLLQMIFAALRRQSFMEFEAIIADDGSSKDIVEKIDALIKTVSFPVKHCWHEDDGWKKNIILNKAIQASQGDYLIFIDGDCIPHRNFIEEHYYHRKQGTVITGRRVQLTKKLSEHLTLDLIESGRLGRWCLPKLLWACLFHQAKHVENALRIKNPFLRSLLIKDKENGILGCNFSIHKPDLLKVNGFDERFLYPGTGEDTDLNSRLGRAGITTLSKKHLLTMYHIYHKRYDLNYQPNLDLWEENNTKKVTFTPYGIKKML